jgi:hypothetical protein
VTRPAQFNGNDPGIFELGWKELPERLPARVAGRHRSLSYVVAEYRRMYPQYTPTEVFFAATTRDVPGVARSSRRSCALSKARRSIAYQLDYRSPLDGGRLRRDAYDGYPARVRQHRAAGLAHWNGCSGAEGCRSHERRIHSHSRAVAIRITPGCRSGGRTI